MSTLAHRHPWLFHKLPALTLSLALIACGPGLGSWLNADAPDAQSLSAQALQHTQAGFNPLKAIGKGFLAIVGASFIGGGTYLVHKAIVPALHVGKTVLLGGGEAVAGAVGGAGGGLLHGLAVGAKAVLTAPVMLAKAAVTAASSVGGAIAGVAAAAAAKIGSAGAAVAASLGGIVTSPIFLVAAGLVAIAVGGYLLYRTFHGSSPVQHTFKAGAKVGP